MRNSPPARSPKASARSPRPFDRHVSGTGTRGLPKKGGAGGKGVWGAAVDQEGVMFLDKNDPNYDSEDELPQAPIAPMNLREPAPPVAEGGAPEKGVVVPGKATPATESAANSPTEADGKQAI